MDRVRDPVAAGGVYAMLAQDGERFARGSAYLFYLREEFAEHSMALRTLNERGDGPAAPRHPRSHHPVDLSLLSQHHSTRRPSPKRYDKRYEEEILKNIHPHQRPRDHEDTGVAPRMGR